MRVRIPGYQLGAKLYESHNSVVYAARRDDGLPVVVKASSQAHPSARHLARLRREFALLIDLALPGTVRPIVCLELDGRPIVVYEDDGGQSLMHLMVSHMFAPDQVVELAAQAARVLHSVHEAGVVHKDISPGNILYNPESGEVRVIDFGIATRLKSEHAPLSDPDAVADALLERLDGPVRDRQLAGLREVRARLGEGGAADRAAAIAAEMLRERLAA